mmetsp:Transcript_4371/g.7698  ORF Transcript_4371/g.7698 Transcript_4371/m.7698 type:complete len:104 (+) Transcript_4371:1397-1708(+)
MRKKSPDVKEETRRTVCVRAACLQIGMELGEAIQCYMPPKHGRKVTPLLPDILDQTPVISTAFHPGPRHTVLLGHPPQASAQPQQATTPPLAGHSPTANVPHP